MSFVNLVKLGTNQRVEFEDGQSLADLQAVVDASNGGLALVYSGREVNTDSLANIRPQSGDTVYADAPEIKAGR